MIVFGFLPFVFIVLLWRWLFLRGFEAREGLLAANVISGLLIVLSTETLSFFRQLHVVSLITFWSSLVLILVIVLTRIPGAFKFGRAQWSLTAVEKMLLGMGVFIVVVVGFIALYAPPNTWDSMTYHMARVGYWRQNGGVMNYPTAIIRQLVYSPFAEYVILHLQVLSGGDRLANTVQWSAMVCSAAGASLIAGGLGISRFGQLAAAVLVLTLPMGILEGSSTQNDHVVAVLVLSAAWFTARSSGSVQRRWLWLSAASVGLAILTKGTGLLLSLPIVLSGLFLPGVGAWHKARRVALTLALTVVLLTPFFFRLLQVDPDPFAALKRGGSVSMEHVGAVETVSNALRGLSTQLALPWKEWNVSIERAVLRWHQSAGIGIVEPRTTSGTPYQLLYFLDEDYMPDPLHMLLILAAGCLFWFIRKKSPRYWFYAAVLAMQALLFCATVRWQPWISRFHLPMFVLAMPLAAAVFERFVPRKALVIIVTAVFLASLHPLLLNNTRRLLSEKNMFRSSREENYFRKHPWEFPWLDQISRGLKSSSCRDVGLKIGSDSWDYSWRVMLGDDFRLEHVGVSNTTAAFAYPRGEFHPCAVVDMSSEGHPGSAVFNGSAYRKLMGGSDLTFYIKENDGAGAVK